MTPPRPLAKFRIYPEGHTLYYRVCIFTTVQQMRTYLKEKDFPSINHSRILGRYGKAMCTSWMQIDFSGKGRPGRYRPILGEIVFAKRWFGAEVIAHECTHAAVAYARRRKFTPMSREGPRKRPNDVTNDEERFCKVLGWLVRQIATQGRKRKIIS